MSVLMWDASALAKRYSREVGTDTVIAVFRSVPASEMVSTFLGYAETFAVLCRQRNRGSIVESTYQRALSLLQTEVLLEPDFVLLNLDSNTILAGLTHIGRHNINSADAAILAVFLEYAQSLPQSAGTCVLVASDQRFLRAAQAEGLAVLDPETVDTADVAALLATL